MTASKIALLVATGALAVTGLSTARAQSASKRSDQALRRSVERELDLTQSAAELGGSLDTFELERGSLAYTRSVLEQTTAESIRRYTAYEAASEFRTQRARARGRALYKLARGGAMRLAFEDLATNRPTTGQRVARGRALRFIIREDLRDLAIHRRSERNASSELSTASRSLQALDALGPIAVMQRKALTQAQAHVWPHLARARHERRTQQQEASPSAKRSSHPLMQRLWASQRELSAQRQLGANTRLTPPVSGAIVGKFGDYKDPTSRITMVRNGVELTAKPGQPVAATASGQVILIADLPGFDRAVVVDHGNNELSLTGRLRDVTVQEGQPVEVGTTLGRVAHKTADDGLGDTVYFELRRGQQPVDPTPRLPNRSISRP